VKITVLRSASCVEGDTCPMIGRVDTDPAWLRMVVIPETDPAVLEAFASHMGPGEILAKFPAEQLPEVQ
jgi:hypothetical protein